MHKPDTPRPKAYSYIRFSTPEQERGDSLRRQTEAAARYAALHGLELDDKLTFRDLGVSAYTGANEETGRLGEFLAAVHHGDIARGSSLLVESLDRLSRQKPRKAVKVLERICEAGIAVVTLDDGRAYTEETLDGDPMALLVALLVASRAHEESAKKARRLSASWDNKRKIATEHKTPITSVCPGWLRVNTTRDGFEIIPERAELVRRIFDQTLKGVGQHSLAHALNTEGVSVFGRGKMWHRSYINKMLADENVIGRFTPHRVERVDGKKVRIPTETIDDYYPAVIEREAFERVAAMIGGRPRSSRAPIANVLAGIARCPLCDATMTRVNKGAGPKQGKPYLVCTRAKVGAGCDYKQVRLEDIEHAISYHVEELWRGLPSPNAALQAQWEELLLQQDVLSDEIDRLVEAVALSGQSRALLDRLHNTEVQRDEISAQLEKIEDQIADSLTNRVQDTVRDLVTRVQEENAEPARINAILRQLFTKVVVDYRDGQLGFQWRHAEDEWTDIVYAMPLMIA
ncbi:recombinase family protein [Rhizobium sp. SL42]|uniref:recombinase family protein n=1 Tax=Rhizobium sp. SL42 TaxID=2806346 RepID=UPI001F17FD05|nr:recombinase family protein [Rhizobium sp. SL42]UJW75798.1 recombinase family protein [Rhizobium sp. SL42]